MSGNMSGNVTTGTSGTHDPTTAGRVTSGNSTSGKVSQGNPLEDIGKMDLSPSAAGYSDPQSFKAKGTEGSQRLDQGESERVDTRDPTSSFQDPMLKSEKSDKSDKFRSDQSYRTDKDSSTSNKSEKSDKSDSASWNKSEKSEKSDKSEKSEKSDKSDSASWNKSDTDTWNQSDKTAKSDTSAWNLGQESGKSDKDSSTWNQSGKTDTSSATWNKSDKSMNNSETARKPDPTSDRMDLGSWKSADSNNMNAGSKDMNADAKNMKVEHNAEKHEFVVRFPGGEDAKLSYKELGNDKVDFFRTYVPPKERGQEVGAMLGEHALDWAKQKNLKTKLSCDYLSTKFGEDPKYEQIIATE
jgi:predicted GNAT family acetyltransferase